MRENPDSIPAIPAEEKPLAASVASKTERATRFAIDVIRIAGDLMLLYWGLHLIQHFQYWDLYQHQVIADSNPLLGAYYRAFIDSSAIAAAMLMIAKSKWSLLPLALHFAAYLCFVVSIMHGYFYWRLFPASILLTLTIDVLLLVLLMVLEARKTLSSWPLRNTSTTATV